MLINNLVKEIRSTFNDLNLNISPELFASRCQAANYRPSAALGAIKEFSSSQNADGNMLVAKWDTIMASVAHLVAGVKKQNLFERSGTMSKLEQLERHADNMLLGFLGPSILEDDSSLNLIKIRLGDNAPT